MAFFNEFPHTRFYDADLGYIIKKIGELLECCDAMQEWKTQHEAAYNELKELYDDVMSGNFPDSIVKAFNNWMRENALDIVGELVKMVFFGLTDSGYFIAYIPDSWDDIIFNTTGYDIGELGVGFGHLTLSY